ncbi:hypothetical protein COF47_26940 [Bacillus wiedmannii]|uniref:hypothetical protein n=1 Tax=Bacillus wiedmannii TaxID=1890302 RepID=UPI000BFD5B12|nr:hypothetical protein [Bacillus wiedmannii]PHE69830.1 hypothetical protein COF47_26940 [Bacillus wiedmannii]
MNKTINYEHTFKIEILNEFSNSVYARLSNYVLKKGIDKNDNNNYHARLLKELSEMLNKNLFNMTDEELDNVLDYWKQKNDLTKKIIKEKSA